MKLTGRTARAPSAGAPSAAAALAEAASISVDGSVDGDAGVAADVTNADSGSSVAIRGASVGYAAAPYAPYTPYAAAAIAPAAPTVAAAPAAAPTAPAADTPPAANGGLGPVVLDAGHGGTDPGSIAVGLAEKDITLGVTLRAAELLDEAGVDCALTRPDDSYMSLEQRADLSNALHGVFLVSVHCDWFEDPTVNGTSTLYDTRAAGGKSLAETIQDYMPESLGTADHGVHPRDGIIVLRDTEIPAVIVELAFMSNAADAGLIATDAFRERAAQNLADGILAALKATRN